MTRSLGNWLLREPLVHFFLLAAALFGVDFLFSASQKTRIVIDRQTAEYLVRQQEDLELRTLSEQEREETIQAYVEDEILYNEAYRRGLDRGDSRMRRNLILKMRGLLTGDLGEPTETELKQFFEAHRDRFSRSASFSLEHVYFERVDEVPDTLLEQLNGKADSTPGGVDSSGLVRQMSGMTQHAIAGAFGPVAAREIVEIEDARWHGPLESPDGVHFVRVVGRTPEVKASYESVQQYLRGDWLMDRSRSAIRSEVERLRDDYEILVEPDS